MKIETLRLLLKAQEHKSPTVLSTNLTSGEQDLLSAQDDAEPSLNRAVESTLRSDKPKSFEQPDGSRVFLNVFNPPLRLIVVGAVHIAQPLVRMAELAGYEVTIVDPREAFATTERFPKVSLSHQWPDEALADLMLDGRTAIVTLSHDPKIDDPALQSALASDCFYIGALGSKKTHAARLERLTAAGLSDTDLARINGPVGLSIGAKSPAEIAISIMAQMTDALRHPPAQPKNISAIVLAAGLSSRMGKIIKLLVDFGGLPMIRHVVQQVLASNVSEVHVVVGHEAEEVKAALVDLPITMVDNPLYKEGLSASLRAGITSLLSGSDATLICLGDMPLVSKTLINSLIDEFDPSQGKSICVPIYEGQRGNPILWSAEFFPEMAGSSGDTGARFLLEHHPQAIIEVPQPYQSALVDIDTHEDFEAIRER